MTKSLILLIAFFSLFAEASFAQKQTMQNELKVIESGLHENSTLRQVDAFFLACQKVGDYYYDRKKFGKAIKYYTKLSDVNLNGHSNLELYLLKAKAHLTYKKVIERLGDMNLEGLGISKSVSAAFAFYNILPSPFQKNDLELFSRKIFGNSTPVFVAPKNNNDSIGVFYLNPFFVADSGAVVFFDKIMSEIENRLSEDSLLRCSLKISVLKFSEIGQAVSQLFLDKILERRKKELQERFITDLDFERPLKFKQNDVEYYIFQTVLKH